MLNYSYSFIEGKKRVITLAKECTMDFIDDMMKEIATQAVKGNVDDVKFFVGLIESAEQYSVKQVEKLDKAYGLGDILRATADDDERGNMLFEQDDLVLSTFFNTKIKCNEVQ